MVEVVVVATDLVPFVVVVGGAALVFGVQPFVNDGLYQSFFIGKPEVAAPQSVGEVASSLAGAVLENILVVGACFEACEFDVDAIAARADAVAIFILCPACWCSFYLRIA